MKSNRYSAFLIVFAVVSGAFSANEILGDASVQADESVSTLKNETAPTPESKLFPPNATILFQGDSITDGNRGRTADPNHILGHGYVFLLGSALGGRNPQANWNFMNRAVSGDTVESLKKRWETDAIAIAPDVLSILIGVNDLWHGKTADEYQTEYDALLQETKQKLPKTQLIIIEPFTTTNNPEKLAEMPKFQQIARDLASKYDAIFVPTQDIFNEKIKNGPSSEYWCWDGVHPTYSGHWLLYEIWLKTVSESK